MTDGMTYEKLKQDDTPKYEPVNSKNNNKAIYSELGQGGGRDHRDSQQPIAPSNYADVKEIEAGMERDYLPAPPIKQKDMFDKVDDEDPEEIQPVLNKDKVFKTSFLYDKDKGEGGEGISKKSRKPPPQRPAINEYLADGKYPEDYTRNEGLAVFEDPNASIHANPPTWKYHRRPQQPGGEKMPPVPYPHFERDLKKRT